MPLNSDDEVIGRVELDGLDDAVLGGDGDDAQIVADAMDGLVVAGVDLDGRLACGKEPGETGARCDLDRVSLDDGATGAVIHGGVGLDREILIERTVAPDIEALGAVADAEDGFVQVEGVLEEEFVDGGTGGIVGAAFGDRSLTVTLRIDVVPAAGQQNTLDGGEQSGDAVGPLMEGHDDGGGSGGVKGGQIGRERALVVLSVGRRGFGDGNADGHRQTSVRQLEVREARASQDMWRSHSFTGSQRDPAESAVLAELAELESWCRVEGSRCHSCTGSQRECSFSLQDSAKKRRPGVHPGLF